MILSENTFYSDPTSKAALLKNHEMLANHFWINFLGICILYNVDANNPKLKHYIRKDRVQLNSITDDNSDFTLIVKLLDEAGMIQSAKSVEITRFNALIKQGKITNVDENILRALIGRLNVNLIKPNVLLKTWVMNFESGKITLSDNNLIKFLYTFSKKNKIGTEFVGIARHMISKIDDDDVVTTAPVVAPPVILPKDKLKNSLLATLATPASQIVVTPTQHDQKWYIDHLPKAITTMEEAFILLYKVWNLDTKSIKKELKMYDLSKLGIDEKTYFDYVGNRYLDILAILTNPRSLKDNKQFNVITNNFDKLDTLTKFHYENVIQSFSKQDYTYNYLIKHYLKDNLRNETDFYDIIVEQYKNSNSPKLWTVEPFYTSILNFMLTSPEHTITTLMSSKAVTSTRASNSIGGDTVQERILVLIQDKQRNYRDTNVNTVIKIIKAYGKYKTNKNIYSLLRQIYVVRYDEETIRKAYADIGLLGTTDFSRGMSSTDLGDKIVLNKDIIKTLVINIFNGSRLSLYATEIGSTSNFFNFVKENGSVTDFLEVLKERGTNSNTKLTYLVYLMEHLGVDFSYPDVKSTVSGILESSNARLLDHYNINDVKKDVERVKTDPAVFDILKTNMINSFPGMLKEYYRYNMDRIYSAFSFIWDLETIFNNIVEELKKNPSNYPEARKVISGNTSELRAFTTDFNKISKQIFEILTIDESITDYSKTTFQAQVSLDTNNTLHLFSDDDLVETFKKETFFSGEGRNDNELLTRYSTSWVFEAYKYYSLAPTVYPKVLQLLEKKFDFTAIPLSKALYGQKDGDIQPKFVIDKFKQVMETLDLNELQYINENGLSTFLNNNFTETEAQSYKEKLLNETDLYRFDIFTDPEKYSLDLKIKITKDEAKKISRQKMKDFKDSISNNLGMILSDIYNSPKKDAIEDIFDLFPQTKGDEKQVQARLQLRNTLMVLPLLKQIVGSDTPIKPEVTLTDKEIHNLLKMNNFEITDVTSGKMIKKTSKMTNVEYFDKVIAAKDSIDDSALELKVEAYKDDTPELLERRTAELYKYYTPNEAHGNVGVKILQSFTVNLKHEEFDEFIKKHPTPVVIPGFHGTGTVAASMILRFGFKVVSQAMAQTAGISYAGKMLGNGLYLGGFVDKTCGYIRDSKSFSRRFGQIGYFLELEAYLGVEGDNYRKAGSGGDNIRSIEYCVTDPRSQVRIVRAHKVMITSRTEVKALYDKYFGNTPVTESTSQFPVMFKTFKEYMIEKNQMTEYIKEAQTTGNVITFEFAENKIPVSLDKFVDADTFEEKYCNSKLTITDGQYGFEVSMNIEEDMWLNVIVPITIEFMGNNPEGLFSQYLLFFDKLKAK